MLVQLSPPVFFTYQFKTSGLWAGALGYDRRKSGRIGCFFGADDGCVLAVQVGQRHGVNLIRRTAGRASSAALPALPLAYCGKVRVRTNLGFGTRISCPAAAIDTARPTVLAISVVGTSDCHEDGTLGVGRSW